MGGGYWSHWVHFLGPFLDSLWRCRVGRSSVNLAFKLDLAITLAVGLTLRQESLMFRTEATDHVNQAAVLGIQLPHVLGISLVSLHADSMAPWDLMFMSLDIFGNLLR
jgi:phytoene dehydrogenase-like protein